MIRNYFKTALRNILRYKGFTFLNIMGLAIGMAASLLILEYGVHEIGYDRFHDRLDDLYRVQYDSYSQGEKQFECATAFPGVGPAMLDAYPEVEAFARLHLRYGGMVVRHEEISIKEKNLFQADQSFLELFSYEWLEGDKKNALVNPNTAVIAEEMVPRYFGTENPIGKRIILGGDEEYEITGIIRSPENSHLKIHFLLSYETMKQWNDWVAENYQTNWGWYDFYTYVQLKPGADIATVESRFPELIRKHTDDETVERMALSLQPVKEIHLYSDLLQEARVNGNGVIVFILLGVAFLILVIAWINYVNLSTARAINRAREVGIRKTVGARKGQIIGQFLIESLLLNVVAAGIALLLLEVVTPWFSELVGIQLVSGLKESTWFWSALLGMLVLGAFFAGLYPAFVLSAFRPVEVLKGKIGSMGASGITLRKTLVVAQFFVSILLIAGTIIVYQQIVFMQNQDLGIDINQTVVVNAPGTITNDSVYTQSLNVFKQRLLENPSVTSVAASSEIPGNLIYWTSGARRQIDPPEASAIAYKVGVDYDYISLFGHDLLAGRNFSEDYGTDDRAVVINEKALNNFGFENPNQALNEHIVTGGDTLQIIGVMANYHQEGLHKAHDPILFLLRPTANGYYSLKVNRAAVREALTFAETAFQSAFPGNPFDYFFLDSFFNRQYKAENNLGYVAGIFASLAILVACLGLLGLASFTASQRTKEIGIRKILGSSASNIFVLLSRDFIVLVCVANLLAIPVVFLLMNKWLEGFAFHIDIAWWVFGISGLASVMVALLTVSYQSLRAARTNPIESLRSE